MQERCRQNSRHTGPELAGVEDLETGPGRRARASAAKAGRAAPVHSGHQACKRGPGRAAGHPAGGGQLAPRPPPPGSAADPPRAAVAAPAPLSPGPGPESRRRPLSPAAWPGCMEPSPASRPAEPAATRETAARHGESRKKMAAAVAAAAAAAASHAPLTPMARAGRRATDGGGGGGGPGSGEGRGESGRGPAGGGGRAGGWREAVGTVCCARNMAGVGDAAAPGEGGGGGADGQERDGRGEAEQPGGSGSHGPPPAPQHTETLGFYESDRRREKRRGRAGEPAGGRVGRGGARGAGGGVCGPLLPGVAAPGPPGRGRAERPRPRLLGPLTALGRAARGRGPAAAPGRCAPRERCQPSAWPAGGRRALPPQEPGMGSTGLS